MSIFRKQDRRNRSLGTAINYNSQLEEVEKRIAAGGDVNATYKFDYERGPMLWWAANRNRADIAKLLLEKGADPNTPGKYNRPPLMLAVQKKNVEMTRALLEAGARITGGNEYRDPEIISAASEGAGDIVKLLVEHGADVNAQLKDGNTALHFAAMKGYANLAAYLIEKGANVAAANATMNTPADVAEKEFPALAAMIRGKTASELPPPADPGWKLVAPDEIAHVSIKEAIGYRVTEIFNFSSRTYTQISANLETRAESQSMKSFSELDASERIEAAHAELIRQGGCAGDAGPKKKLPAPGI